MTSPIQTVPTACRFRLGMDAGELREYLALVHGQILTCGGDARCYRRATQLCLQLGRMIGMPQIWVIEQVKSDWSLIAEELGY